MSTTANAQTTQQQDLDQDLDQDPKTLWELGLITDAELEKYLSTPHPGSSCSKTGPLVVFMPKASPSPLDPRVQIPNGLSLLEQKEAVRKYLSEPHPGKPCCKTGSLAVHLPNQ